MISYHVMIRKLHQEGCEKGGNSPLPGRLKNGRKTVLNGYAQTNYAFLHNQCV